MGAAKCRNIVKPAKQMNNNVDRVLYFQLISQYYVCLAVLSLIFTI